jgi:hypothetical protein
VADISAITDGIATRVRTITSLQYRTYAFGKDFVDPPAVVVVPAPGEFLHETSLGGGSYDATFLIKLLIGAATDRPAQDQLSDYMDTSGASSIKTAVDGTLGGVVAYAYVSQIQSIGDVEWAGMVYDGCEFVVEVGT